MGVIVSQMFPRYRLPEERSPLLDPFSLNPGHDPRAIVITPKKSLEDESKWLATETPRQSAQSVQSGSPTSRVSATPMKTEPEGEPRESKIKQDLDLDQMSPDQVLFYYASKGDVDGIQKSYRQGARINIDCDGDGDEPVGGNYPYSQNYPLHAAAEGGHLEAVNELIELKADLEVCNRLGSTPLLRACSNNYPEIVHRLLKEGANPFVINKAGNTALHVAAYGGFVEVARCLLEFSAAPCLQSLNLVGMTPFQVAQISASQPILKLFQRFKKRKQKEKETSVSFVDTPAPDVLSEDADFLKPPNFDIPGTLINEDQKTDSPSPVTTPQKKKRNPPNSYHYQRRPSTSEHRDHSNPTTPSKSSEHGSPSRAKSPHSKSHSRSQNSQTRGEARRSKSNSKAERTRQRISHINSLLAS